MKRCDVILQETTALPDLSSCEDAHLPTHRRLAKMAKKISEKVASIGSPGL